ncbi:hypothetical protein [Pseudomonas sp. W5-36]|uniref:hypothetical protein n=1 Tax=Pseudomonas sp. W5-36 TaxID=3097455 RepID=UPI00397D401F
MDKILLTAFLTALAGFITAALSIVKLVNEKESKTTEFRQAWTLSARASLAELIASINSYVSAVVSSKDIGKGLFDNLKRLHNTEGEQESKLLGNVVDQQFEQHHAARARAVALYPQVQQAYASARLHFKINDPEFTPLEHKYDYCAHKIEELLDQDDDKKWDVLREQVFNATSEMTVFSRSLLKAEWEKVKKGESAYQKTKRWSVWFCVSMLVLLIAIGVHAFIGSKPLYPPADAPAPSALQPQK